MRWYTTLRGQMLAHALRPLKVFPRLAKTVLIAGGDAKDADFSSLAPVVEATARAVVLIGETLL